MKSTRSYCKKRWGDETIKKSPFNEGSDLMELTSLAFSNGEEIPEKYAARGDNISPPLEITHIPAGTISLVLIMDDPDIPDFVRKKKNIAEWDHWVVFNISPDITEIGEGQNLPGVMGKNTSGKNRYDGPAPPDKQHRYFFRLYALDTLLDLPVGSTKKTILEATGGHVLETAELMGLFSP